MTQNTTLVDQKLALSLFLDSLLREPHSDAPGEAAAVVEPAPRLSVVKPAQTQPRPVSVAPDLAPLPSTSAVAEPLAVSRASADVADVPVLPKEAFQALLFTVAGLTLAVPLIELHGIVEWDAGAVTPMPGHAAFYLGLLHYRERSVPIIDPAPLVLPAERQRQLGGDPRDRVARVVMIDEGRWGLACDAVHEVVTLQPQQVRWRTRRTARRWLAGTVIDHMCALLDTRAFAGLLAAGRE